MTKIIVIETCADCPHLYSDYEYDVTYVCTYDGNCGDPDGIQLKSREIPIWCRLTDKQESGLIKYKRWLEDKLEDQRIEEYQEQQEQNLQKP